MRQHAAIAIAALMIASMAFAVTASTVSAVHDQTPTIDETTVKGSTSMILTITVANAGPAAIDNVRITVPSGFEGFAPTIKLFKDNKVTLEDNVVTLPAGTLVQLGACTLVAVENTLVIIPSGTKIRWKPAGDNVDGILSENLDAKITENFPIFDFAENVGGTGDIVITLGSAYGTAKLLEDTQVVRGTDNKVKLPKATTVQLVGETTATISADNQVTLKNEKVVDLGAIGAENTISPPGDNLGRTFVALAGATTNTIYMVSADDNVLVWDTTARSIAFPAGTELVLDNNSVATLFENTQVVRAVNEDVKMEAATAEAAENQPNNWMQYDDTPGAQDIEWKGIGENQIASGGNLEFPFAVTTHSTSGDYTIIVRTKDTAGNVTVKEVTLTVDGTEPTVEISVSPSWAKANTAVTITVTADESLAKLDNVMVAEKDAPENTQISMTPNADNTVWTGTYTTSDNVDRDGLAMVYVIGAQLEDLVGNAGATDPTDNFNVDKVKPPTPSVMGSIYGWTVPTTKYTNNGGWLIEGYAQDNYLTVVDNTEGMTVKVRVGTTTYDLTSGAGGYFHKSITLAEGVQEVGIQYVDKAGNAGDENAEDITYDPTVPSITLTSIGGVSAADLATKPTNDDTPTIKLTISDATLGVENEPFADNVGYAVSICDENEDMIEELTNALAWDRHTLNFENTYENAQPDGTYYIFVQAGDNLQSDNTYFKFVIDTTAPGAPGVPVGSVLEFTTAVKPYVTREPSISISGAGDPGDTVNVYLDDETTPTETAKVATAGTWSAQISLTGGHVTKISVSETDVAGNESAKQVWGYTMSDATAPAATLAALPDTTDKSSITISGTVKKDPWEEWPDITLTVQLGTGQVTVPIMPVSGDDGSYSYSLSLAEGSNTIVVQAIDDAGNASLVAHAVVERVITPWAIYAIILVIVALILAAIAIFGGPRLWKR